LVEAERPAVLLLGDPAAHRVGAYRELSGVPYLPVFYGSDLHAMRTAVRYRGLSPIRAMARRATRRYLAGAAGTVCISRYTAGLLERLGMALRPGTIVYPCVSDLVLSQPERAGASARLRARLGWPEDGIPTLLTVARISERKNQLGVLDALSGLHAKSSVRYRYAIVGNVDSEAHRAYRRRLDEFVEARGLSGFVGWIERATDQEKVVWLDGCDVFAMLSRTVGGSAEGFGISVIEASCRGKPVVVSDQGGMPETIQEGRTGFSVAVEDPDAAARALAALADPALRARFGASGRAFACAEFTPRASAQRLRTYVEGLAAFRARISRGGR
jgi:phosphatidylinositol alpha-1,6-mannosyltransferase